MTPRYLLTGLGGFLAGVTAWAMVGFSSMAILARTPGGQREGMARMTDMFFYGPIGGLAGLLAGGWIIWRLTADPSRQAWVALRLAVLLGVIVVAGIALATRQPYSGAQGVPGLVQVEVSIPGGSATPARMRFQLRAGAGDVETRAIDHAVRHEGASLVVPGEFTLGTLAGDRLFAVMDGDRQVATPTVPLPDDPSSSSPWTPWQTMEGTTEMRWRIQIEGK